MGIPSGEVILSFPFLPPFSLGSSFKAKEFAPLGSNFLRVDPFMQGLGHPGKQSESHRSCLP